jgi:anti-sigma28 factor (negative regulator of flagellin synthesis)
MNMKIQGEGLSGANALEISRTQDPKADSTGSRHNASGIAAYGGDSVSVSNLASKIAQSSLADEHLMANRVSHLAALYARGEYRPDSASLSRALVSQSLSSRNEAGES